MLSTEAESLFMVPGLSTRQFPSGCLRQLQKLNQRQYLLGIVISPSAD